MEQVDRQFSPYILVVQKGAEGEFPNSDSIKHHVFSFSAAKTFEIRLYGDDARAPVTFERASSASRLGC